MTRPILLFSVQLAAILVLAFLLALASFPLFWSLLALWALTTWWEGVLVAVWVVIVTLAALGLLVAWEVSCRR